MPVNEILPSFTSNIVKRKGGVQGNIRFTGAGASNVVERIGGDQGDVRFTGNACK
jgi:hypothetical protein